MPALVARQLSKTYRNGFEALKGVDLTVEEGDFFALLGPNGSGKTTLLRAIAGLERPTSGAIAIGERVFFDGARGIEMPAERAKAIVEATTHFNTPEILAQVSENLGEPMVGISVSTLPESEQLATRGW